MNKNTEKKSYSLEKKKEHVKYDNSHSIRLQTTRLSEFITCKKFTSKRFTFSFRRGLLAWEFDRLFCNCLIAGLSPPVPVTQQNEPSTCFRDDAPDPLNKNHSNNNNSYDSLGEELSL